MRPWEVCGTYEPSPEMQEFARKYEGHFVALPADYRSPSFADFIDARPEPKEANNDDPQPVLP